MVFIYHCFTTLIVLLFAPVTLFHPRHRSSVLQRLGLWKIPPGDYLWFHAASLGEAQGQIELIKLYRKRHPDVKVLATATSQKGVERLAPYADYSRYLVIDNIFLIKRLLSKVKIIRFIYGETEIWPALINELSLQSVPIYMLNARLSPLNFKNYLIFKDFIGTTLRKCKKIFPIDQGHYDRFQQLGVDISHLKLLPNLKYQSSADSKISHSAIADYLSNITKPVLALSCIRPGEEGSLLGILQKYQEYQIVFIPRHAEKYEFFKSFFKAQGLPVVFSSRLGEAQELKEQICFVDQYGVLPVIYRHTNFVFMGGSLVPDIGGHSPVEAAAFDNVLMIGPHYVNQDDNVQALLLKQAIKVISNSEELLQVISEDPEILEKMSAAAKTVWLSYQGNVEIAYQEIFND